MENSMEGPQKIKNTSKYLWSSDSTFVYISKGNENRVFALHVYCSISHSS